MHRANKQGILIHKHAAHTQPLVRMMHTQHAHTTTGPPTLTQHGAHTQPLVRMMHTQLRGAA
jgi:hypothetical protein